MNSKIAYKSTRIHDFLLIHAEAAVDYRGYNYEGYNKEHYNKLFGREIDFKVDSYARSTKNVLRGLHGDFTNWKLIDVLHGEVYFVVIDMEPKSPTYRGKEEIVLTGNNRLQAFLPPGCVNGHYVMSEEALFHYRLSHGFTPQSDQMSVKWNDPSFNFVWPSQTPILSKRDE